MRSVVLNYNLLWYENRVFNFTQLFINLNIWKSHQPDDIIEIIYQKVKLINTEIDRQSIFFFPW